MATDTMRLFDPYHGGMDGTHSNPYYQYSQLYTPKRLKELFIWCEYLFYQSPHIFAALRKFGEYPITKITYETVNEHLKTKHKDLLEKTLRVREFLIKCSLDKYVYGNAFVSMYQPFVRYLKCPSCSSLSNIKNTTYTFDVSHLKFTYTCPSCKKRAVVGEENIEDRKLLLSKGINFIRWDAKDLDIDHNPLTGESTYYYKIPSAIVSRVNSGHKMLIDTMPIGFLKAIKEHKPFKFARDAIFRMKVGAPAGINPQWGLPPILAALERFHFTQILRKANEAIALDYLVPFRILHASQASGVADPVQQISLSKWRDELDINIRLHRKDPLHIMYSPIPVGMVQLGGQGRALLTLGEIQEAEKSIVATLGIPMEFLYGGLTGRGMEATLRMIENQLSTHIADLIDLMQWMDDKCAEFLGWEKVKLGLTPFRMVDDFEKQQLMFSVWQSGKQSGSQVLSDTTMCEIFEIDPKREEERIKDETLRGSRISNEIQREMQKQQNAIAAQSQQEANTTLGSYNQQQVIANADQLVAELSNMEYGAKKSRLHQLQMEDFVLYSVVIQRLKLQNTQMLQQNPAQGTMNG